MAAKRNRRPDVDEADVRRRIADGESRASIARSYGMSSSSLSHYCRVRGIGPAAGNLQHEDRQPMPDDLDVRTLPEYPELLFGSDGIIYSTLTDPPLARSPRVGGSNQALRMIVGGRQVNCTRLMCEAWHGPPPPGGVAHRLNGQPDDIRPENLQWLDARHRQVSGTEFVRAWQMSESVAEVADRLGLTDTTCRLRADRLREHGVPLRELTTGRNNYDDLAALARELAPDE